MKNGRNPGFQRLLTEEGEELLERAGETVPWNVYPRPQLARDRWQNLNGYWEFEVNGEPGGWIFVPFCPESLLSGVEKQVRPGDVLLYRRFFRIPEDWGSSRVIINFGGVARKTVVRINGREAVTSENGYLPFSADITDLLSEDGNVVEVEAVNDLSPKYPYGKQTSKRGGMWYTPSSGIWQTVWLEPVPEKHIKSIKIKTNLAEAEITVDGSFEEAPSGVIECGGRVCELKNGKAVVAPETPVNWTPENPKLYEFTLKCGKDTVKSYFALRTVSIAKDEKGVPRICLNGEPLFLNGLLDQGYFSDGLYTPASPESYRRDIETAKKHGFNMLRKHIKIEPELFYYECDRIGVILIQDMVNCGKYSFLRDTALPSLLDLRLDDRKLCRDPEIRRNFLEAVKGTVTFLYNHPSVCGWTVFNEGWGQHDSEALYKAVKDLDGTRFIDTASGWFRPRLTDVTSLHIYFKKLKLPKNLTSPVIISEYGGYVFKIPEHSFNLSKTYGYRFFKTGEDYKEACSALFLEVDKLREKGLSGAVYTQLSDVEDETNGILTFDRKINKLE